MIQFLLAQNSALLKKGCYLTLSKAELSAQPELSAKFGLGLQFLNLYITAGICSGVPPL